MQWPEITFVLGKGGVGRSTVAAALGSLLARRGARVLIVEWTVAEAIAPWFGHATGEPDRAAEWKWIPAPKEIAPGLWVFNYRLQEAIRGYFVDHLHLSWFYRRVVNGPHLRRLIEAAPGIAELMFLGQLSWLTTYAKTEAEPALHFDRLIVDAPATGHGVSLLELPATLTSLGATGLLAKEMPLVEAMLADPQRSGALIATLPEELAIEETLELLPRTTRHLGRKPLALLVNRSVAGLVAPAVSPPSPDPFASLGVSTAARAALATGHAELQRRARLEDDLRRATDRATEHGVWAVREQLAVLEVATPAQVIGAAAESLAPLVAGLS